MIVGIYPGSFDPVTLGHVGILTRASRLVDKLYVCVSVNSSKAPLFTVAERVEMLKTIVAGLPGVEVVSFSGLTVEFAKSVGAKMIVRGLRAVTDFEYELQIAQTNHKLNPNIDTVCLTTDVEYTNLSSSMVKEIASYGGDISGFVPVGIVRLIYEKYGIK
jgi:pantetheine-phosphate adenylyltransferase